MAARKVKCASCGTPFAPQRSTAKYCQPACREKARRDRAAAAKSPAKGAAKRPARAAKRTARKPAARKTKTETPPTDTDTPTPTPATGLVDTVRRDLAAVNAVDTFNGQLALELARRVANPDEPSTSALSKELRAVMTLAVGAAATAGQQPKAEAPPEDEVEKARRKREEARQAAGLS